jgi:uncharacterized protein
MGEANREAPFPRRMHHRLRELLAEEPVVQLVGPRASGKSYTSGAVIQELGGTALRLDDVSQRRLAAADPGGFLAERIPPVLIDEYQHVPALKSVIKARLSERGVVPGQYLLTGSVSADIVGEPERLTGRIHRARMHPLSEVEFRRCAGDGVLPLLLGDHLAARGWRDPEASTSVDYLAAACRGGFPLAVMRAEGARRRWLLDYVQDTVLRDALDHAGIRKPQEMQRLLTMIAGRTACVFKAAGYANDLGMNRQTVTAYQEILTGLFILDELPAWRTNRSQRLIRSPKIHVADTGLAAAILGVDVAGLRADATLAGQILESFVSNELAKQASWLDDPPDRLHFSESERAEVDVVLERRDGGVFGIEVKLADHIEGSDLRGLRRLRELAGDRWAGGAVFAAVPAAYRPDSDHDVIVLPISALWSLAA